MHYYSSADKPFLGPPLIFCAPHFNFIKLKWGAQKKSGGPEMAGIRAGNGPPHFQFASYAPGMLSSRVIRFLLTFAHRWKGEAYVGYIHDSIYDSKTL